MARTPGDAGGTDGKRHRDLRLTTTDEFLAKAAAEYEKGHVDQALWRRAGDQCGGDLSLVVATYLRSRATALQLQHNQDHPSEIQARGASSMRGANGRTIDSDPHQEIVSTKFVGDRPRSTKPRLWHLAAAVAVFASTVVGVYIMVSPPESGSVRHPAAPGAPNPSKQTAPPVSGLRIDKNATGGTNLGSAPLTLAATVQQLKSAGKWQVLVLNATEWTRREPENATAWSELSFGYARLEQFGDALDAANRAVQLSPRDPLLWRNLGRLNLDVDRLPDAATAFAKALAISPDDTDALCGAALVAQRQARPKGADAIMIAKRVKAPDGSCPDAGDSAGATAPVVGTSQHRP